MEPQTSPILSPPPTDFPYPEPKKARKGERTDSDSTLYESEDGGSRKIPRTSPSAEALRPSLPAAKYQTEISRPTAQRQPLAMMHRKSTNGRQLAQPKSTLETGEWSDASSSLSSSSSEETRPLTGTAQLNQVRRRPRKPSRADTQGTFSGGNDQFQTRGKVSQADGRLHISVNETANSGYLAKALGATLHRHLHPQHVHMEAPAADSRKEEKRGIKARIPTLNIVIMVIGSRGDIQPFLKIGKILKEDYGHRVRIATHPTFKTFVEKDIGLEFFSVGGDPSELMAFMVKNPGLIPKMETVKAGEIGRRRESMYEMFQGFWRACINATDDEKDVANLKMMGTKYPFVADAIIANPPSFAHFHCAEKLGVPLHLVFTFPYTPTQSFPHPLANIKASNVDENYTNFMSYPLVELMTWQGLGDLVNKFRTKALGLEPLSTLWAPGQLSRLQVPFTYLWSPGLVPKPKDWGPEIDIAGYVFLDLASSFKPAEPLTRFLLDTQSEKPLVYVGFGSISGIQDPVSFTKMIFDAVETAGVRAVVSKGWGGMGDGMDIPDSIYMIDNVPHDWLFPQVDAVIHHGGAGTTAIGLKCGKPTMIVPFFGDQPFWSAMIVRAGAGAKRSLGLKKLTAEKFAEGIRECLLPEAKEKAAELATRIAAEGDGAANMVDSFHAHLPLAGEHSMRCSIFADRVAVWTVKHTQTSLSALAADILVESKHLKWRDLELKKHYEWHDFQGPGEPVTGAGGAFISALHEAVLGLSSIPTRTRRDMKLRERHRRKRKHRTVADAMALPGQIAQARQAMRGVQEPAMEMETVNLSGEAEPPKAACKNLSFTRKAPAHAEPTSIGGRLSRSNTPNLPPVPSRPALIVKSAAVGLGHTAKALASMPVDVLNALALGFRNAPRLYGDPTVRPPPHQITGVRSGLRAAGSELGLGFYDGVAGLVRLPYADMKEDGAVGLAIGLGKGVGGLFLKPISGMVGVGAYTSKGVEAELRKHFRDTLKTEHWIRRARMNQGEKDVRESMDRSDAGARHGREQDELEEIRTQALARWTSREQRQVDEARDKEEHAILPNPKTHYYRRKKDKVARAVEG